MYKIPVDTQRKSLRSKEKVWAQILVSEQSGQATVEYAMALAAFLALLMGLGVLAKALMEGTAVQGAALAAPGTAAISVLAAAQDILLF